MLPRRDDIPLLPRRAGTIHQRDRDQVLPEIPRRRVDGQTLAVGRPDLDVGEGARGGLVALVGFGCRGGVEDAAGAGDGEGGCWVAAVAGSCCGCCGWG